MNIIKSLLSYLLWCLAGYILLSLLYLAFHDSTENCFIKSCGDIVTYVLPPFLNILHISIGGILLAPILVKILKPLVDGVLDKCAPLAKTSFSTLMETMISTTDKFGHAVTSGNVPLFSSHHLPQQSSIMNSMLSAKSDSYVSSFFQKVQSQETKDQVRTAQKLLDKGSYKESIELCRKILEENDHPEIYKFLLSAYAKILKLKDIAGFNRVDILQGAESMLGDYGDPIHFVTVAYNYWQNDELESAINIAETGLTKYNDFSGSEEGYKAVFGLKNSLAYFLADSAYKTKDFIHKDRAKQLIVQAISYWEGKVSEDDQNDSSNESNRESYSNYVDTQGYVGIVFCNDEAELFNSYKNCQTAYEMGASRELFIKHTKIYQERLGELNTDKNDNKD